MLKKAGGVILLLLLGFFIFILPIKTEVIFLAKDGEVLKAVDASSTNFFEVSFKHSVNKGIVRERYYINQLNNSFYLKTGWFESYGAGMLDELPDGVQMSEDGDFLKLEFPKETLDNIWYAAAGIAKHKIEVGDTIVDLYELNPYKTTILKVRHTTLFSSLLQGIKS